MPNLEKILIEVLGKETNDKTQMEVIVQRLYRMAKGGNLKAAEILMERGYGKVAQKMQILPPDVEPTKFVLPGGREINI